MESCNGDRLNKKETCADDLNRKSGYFTVPSDCMRVELLLDDYVFSRDDVSSGDAAFLDAHIRNCQECKAKYTELLQWKNLLTSAKYKAPESLRKSVMDYINEEHKKNSKRILFKKNMFRFSAAVASVFMLTVVLCIISVMNKNPMSDNMSTQNDMIMYSENFSEVGGESEYETAEPFSDESFSHFSFDGDAGDSEDNGIDLNEAFADEQEYMEADAVSPENSIIADSQLEPVPDAFMIVENESADEEPEPEYEKRVAITSVASSPPPVSEGKKFVDSVFMLDYVSIIIGEEAVQQWLDEMKQSKSDVEKEFKEIEEESDSESVQEDEPERSFGICPPILYKAIEYFGIHEETLIALDKESEGAEYHLGEDAIKALYSQNWEALYKS